MPHTHIHRSRPHARYAKRALSAAFAALMLCGALLASSCSNGGSNTATTNGAANGDTTAALTTAGDTSAVQLKPNVPVVDYQGYNFRISDRSQQWNGGVHWVPRDIIAESETGDPINDAVYKRNTYIEDTYNIKISEVPSTNMAADIAKSVKAGGNDFDIIEAGPGSDEAALAQQGILLDLKTLPNLELTMPWWDQNANAQLSIQGHLYFTTSNLAIIDKDATWVVLFDKKLLQDYGLDDPYQLVANNQWTMQKMFDMSKVAVKDLNGDGVMDDTDQWGLDTQYDGTTHFFNAGGQLIASKDSSDTPQITTLDDPNAANVLDLAYQIQTAPSTINVDAAQWTKKFPNNTVWDTMQVPMFAADRALFYMTGMNRVTLLRSMQTDFGILPDPKYDSSQADYHVPVDMWCATALAIPRTASDIDRTTIITEALTAESQYTLLPAYYDISLKTQLARDTQSGAMMDLIFANRCYDIGRLYNWGSLAGTMDALASQASNNFASKYASMQKAAQTALAKTIAEFNQYAG